MRLRYRRHKWHGHENSCCPNTGRFGHTHLLHAVAVARQHVVVMSGSARTVHIQTRSCTAAGRRPVGFVPPQHLVRVSSDLTSFVDRRFSLSWSAQIGQGRTASRGYAPFAEGLGRICRLFQPLVPASIAGATSALCAAIARVSSKRSNSKDHRDSCARRPSSRLSASRMTTSRI